MKVCVGGTFDILHKGHKTLIDRAFEVAGERGKVFIGVSDGNLAEKKGKVLSFKERIENLENYLKKKGFRNYEIIPIYDEYGLTLEEDFDAIVVSEETFMVAEKINREREKRGLKKLKIFKVQMVLAKDGRPISSSRIRKGEIDENGNLR